MLGFDWSEDCLQLRRMLPANGCQDNSVISEDNCNDPNESYAFCEEVWTDEEQSGFLEETECSYWLVDIKGKLAVSWWLLPFPSEHISMTSWYFKIRRFVGSSQVGFNHIATGNNAKTPQNASPLVSKNPAIVCGDNISIICSRYDTFATSYHKHASRFDCRPIAWSQRNLLYRPDIF
jgi:hypothetical protein